MSIHYNYLQNKIMEKAMEKDKRLVEKKIVGIKYYKVTDQRPRNKGKSRLTLARQKSGKTATKLVFR